MEDRSLHRSLARALDILELCGTCSTGYTLSQLSHKLQAPKSSLFPLVHTLKNRGYLILDPSTQRFHIGSMAFHVGNHYIAGDTIMGEIEYIMQEVVNTCNVTSYFGSLKGGEVFYIKQVQPSAPFLMTATEGRTLPAYATGIGKALLLDHTLPMLTSLYYEGLYALTENTITDFFTLSNQLARMRVEGFAHEEEESTPQVRCIAVPIRKQGQILAALSAALAVTDYSCEKERLIQKSLDQARSRIESLICKLDIVF